MALWGNNDQANNAPKFRVIDKFVSGQNATGAANAYNTSVQGATVVAANVTEAKVTDAVTHPGWIVVREGTGPVESVTGSGGTGYVTGDTVTISGGTENATGTITASAGAITGITMTGYGRGFKNDASVSVATSGAGTGGTITVKLGGRANRRHYETLVAMGSITGDGTDDTLLPDS